VKILHINTFYRGGAAIACIRIHKSLLDIGVDSTLLTLSGSDDLIEKSFGFETETANSFLQKLIFRLKTFFYNQYVNILSKNRPGNFDFFSFPDAPHRIIDHPLYKKADIIHLHWISHFLSYDFFSKTKKKLYGHYMI